jgi:hypothetical protein
MNNLELHVKLHRENIPHICDQYPPLTASLFFSCGKASKVFKDLEHEVILEARFGIKVPMLCPEDFKGGNLQ